MPSTMPDAFFRHPLKPCACVLFGVYACSGPAEWGDTLKKSEFQNTERKQRCFAKSLRNTAAGNLNIHMPAHSRGENKIFWPDIEIAIVYKDDFFAECNCPLDQCFLRGLIKAQDAKMDPVVNIDDAFR